LLEELRSFALALDVLVGNYGSPDMASRASSADFVVGSLFGGERQMISICFRYADVKVLAPWYQKV
jgi:hypothetical protein